MTRFLIALILLVSTVAAIPGLSANRRKADVNAPSAEAVRKADRLFLEAQQANAIGHRDAMVEYLAHAYAVNPSDRYIGFLYGLNLIYAAAQDSATLARGYGLMKQYVDATPDDFYSSILAVSIAQRTYDIDYEISIWERLYKQHPDRSVLPYRLATALAKTGLMDNINRALALYDTIQVAEGRSIPLVSEKIRLHYIKGDTTSILSEVATLADENTANVDVNIFAGDIFSQFDAPRALDYYNKALQLEPSNGLVHYSLANYYHAQNDSVAFDREVFTALTDRELDVEPKLEILRGYISALYSDPTQQPRIDSLFAQLMVIHPHQTEIHNMYADYLASRGDYGQAAEQAEYSVDIEPGDASRWSMLASLLLLEKRYDETVSAVHRGLSYHPDNVSLYLIGASAATQNDDAATAHSMLKAALDVTPPDDIDNISDILTATGDAFYSEGLADSAFVYYNRAIELNPENMTALNNCAYYLACQNQDLDRALTLIERVVAERPEDATSLDTYAWVMFMKGDYAEARRLIDLALEYADNPSADIYDHAGDIYYMMREASRAVELWTEALELEPDNALIRKKVTNRAIYFE